MDTETGDYLPDRFGRCDRESRCGYHLNPYTDGYAKDIREQDKGQRGIFNTIKKTAPIKNKGQPQQKSPYILTLKHLSKP